MLHTFFGFFGDDIADVVLAACSEDLSEPLRSFKALSGESVSVLSVSIFGWFLPVTDHVDDWERLA